MQLHNVSDRDLRLTTGVTLQKGGKLAFAADALHLIKAPLVAAYIAGKDIEVLGGDAPKPVAKKDNKPPKE